MYNVRRFCISFPNFMFKVNVVAYRISLSLT